jgi:hypothetical protein
LKFERGGKPPRGAEKELPATAANDERLGDAGWRLRHLRNNFFALIDPDQPPPSIRGPP